MTDFKLNLQEFASLPEPYVYEYYDNLNNRTIVINEDVNNSLIDNVILPLLKMDNDGTGKEITIYLNTLGGEVYVGFALCSVIEKLKTPTKIIALGHAFSMGALILCAGINNPNVRRYCYEFTVGLVHGGSDYIQGTSSQVKDYYKFSEKYENKVKQFILTHSKIDENKYEQMSRYEWYMTAEDMVEHGLIDEII